MIIPEEIRKIADDICTMRIRGATPIAKAAVEGLKIAAQKTPAKTVQEFYKKFKEIGKFLQATRPSAVSLPNGIRYVLYRVKKAVEEGLSLDQVKSIAINVSNEFIEKTNTAKDKIGEIGAKLIKDGDTILTHCNSSIALSIIKTAHRQGKEIKVYATETRPRYQGHLTIKELNESGIPTTLIVDSAAGFFMKEVDKVIVGADTILVDGTLIYKIGLFLIALAARKYNVPLYVGAETYKFCPESVTGEIIEIEERDSAEIIDPEKIKDLKYVTVRNPAFDYIPPEYIKYIITEKGIIPPHAAIIVLREEYGWPISTPQI